MCNFTLVYVIHEKLCNHGFTKERNITEPLQPVDRHCTRMRHFEPTCQLVGTSWIINLSPSWFKFFLPSYFLFPLCIVVVIFALKIRYSNVKHAKACKGNGLQCTIYLLLQVPFVWYLPLCVECKYLQENNQKKRKTISLSFYDGGFLLERVSLVTSWFVEL